MAASVTSTIGNTLGLGCSTDDVSVMPISARAASVLWRTAAREAATSAVTHRPNPAALLPTARANTVPVAWSKGYNTGQGVRGEGAGRERGNKGMAGWLDHGRQQTGLRAYDKSPLAPGAQGPTHRQLDGGARGWGACWRRGRRHCNGAVHGGRIRGAAILAGSGGGRGSSGSRLLMAGGVHGIALARQAQGHNLAPEKAPGDVLVVKLPRILEVGGRASARVTCY